MSINSLENATKYSEELDKMFAQKSATGFFADKGNCCVRIFMPRIIKTKGLSH